MGNFGIFKGTEFLTKEITKRDWLIHGLIKEKDAVLWVGQEKSGKTLFMMQAGICCLTTGHPLMDKYEVPKEKKVTYILLEGELGESQDRLKRLSSSLDIDPNNFVFVFLPRLQLHSKQGQYGLLHLISEIKKHNCHEVVIIDPLYKAFCGSLNDDKIVREVVTNLDELKDALDCTLIVVHHTHKKKFDVRGKVIIEGDDATYGSVWFKAWASHIVMQTYNQTTGIRSIYCNTQRSGDIMRECNIRLVEPDPLYFQIDSGLSGREENWGLSIIELLKKEEYKEGLSREEIQGILLITKNAFFSSLKTPYDLIAKGILKKNNKIRPAIYYYNYDRVNGNGVVKEEEKTLNEGKNELEVK